MLRRQRLGVAGRLAVAQALVSVVVAVLVLVLGWVSAQDRLRESAESRVLGAAGAIAADPSVARAIAGEDPTAALQPYALEVMRRSEVAFVTIMSPQGIRWTHPDPSRIGERFVGDIAPAQAGRTFTEEYVGTLGPSVRAVAPIRADGRIVGLVAVGVLTASVQRALLAELPALVGIPLAVLVLGLVVALLLARWLRRVTGDRHPADLARMLDSDDAILHGLDEGLLLLDADGAVVHANDRAAAMLGDAAVREQARTALAGPPGDAVLLVGDRVLVASRTAGSGGRTVVILRDATELRRLSGELETMRTLSTALRAQAHEHANRLHTIVSLIELGRPSEAAELAVLTTAAGQQLADALTEQLHDPVLVALLIGKSSEAEERGVELVASAVDLPPTAPLDAGLRSDLVTILGNLVDNAFDAVQEAPPPRRVRVVIAGDADGGLLLTVEDTGPGLPAGAAERVFERGWSTKPDAGLGRGIGLALVRAAAARRGGTVLASAVSPHGARFVVALPAALPLDVDPLRTGSVEVDR